jgi:hypothetical protein
MTTGEFNQPARSVEVSQERAAKRVRTNAYSVKFGKTPDTTWLLSRTARRTRVRHLPSG